MKKYLQRLKESGLKVTPKRKAVVELFVQSRTLLKPQDVHSVVRRKISPLGLPTIYRILNELCQIGLITRIQSDDGQLCYTFRASQSEHRHYFLCRKCNKVEEFIHCNFTDISRYIRNKLGAKAETHQLQIEGLCSKCK